MLRPSRALADAPCVLPSSPAWQQSGDKATAHAAPDAPPSAMTHIVWGDSDAHNWPFLGTGGEADYIALVQPRRDAAWQHAAMDVAASASVPSLSSVASEVSDGARPWRGVVQGQCARQEPTPFRRRRAPQPVHQDTSDHSEARRLVAQTAALSVPPAAPQIHEQNHVMPHLGAAIGTPLSTTTSSARATVTDLTEGAASSTALAEVLATASKSDVGQSSLSRAFVPRRTKPLNTVTVPISAPVMQVSAEAQARILQARAARPNANVFGAAVARDPSHLAHYLAQAPHAVAAEHPTGQTLLHFVVRQCAVEHLQVVLNVISRLSLHQQAHLLNDVAADNQDAVRIAICRNNIFMLHKLLAAGANPARHTHRRKASWLKQAVRPLLPHDTSENAAAFAMRKNNPQALDLLLLWDEAWAHEDAGRGFAFDLDTLKSQAMGIDSAPRRNAVVDVLHAAQRRRSQK